MAACNPAWAQTPGDILQRLEALEQSNADLKKENAALRDRVRRIESARQTATAAPTAQSGSTPPQATAGYAANAAAGRPVYKAAPMGVPAAFSWTGFYLGGHGGFAWATSTSGAASAAFRQD